MPMPPNGMNATLKLLTPTYVPLEDLLALLNASVPRITYVTRTHIDFSPESLKIDIYGYDMESVRKAKRMISEKIWPDQISSSAPAEKKKNRQWAKPDKPDEKNGFANLDESLPSQPGTYAPYSHAPLRTVFLTNNGDIQPHHVFNKVTRNFKYLECIGQETKTEFMFDVKRFLLVIKGRSDDDIQYARDRTASVEKLLITKRMEESLLDFDVRNISKSEMTKYARLPNSEELIRMNPRAGSIPRKTILYRLCQLYRVQNCEITNGDESIINDTAISSIGDKLEQALHFCQYLNYDIALKLHIGNCYLQNVPVHLSQTHFILESNKCLPIEYLFDPRVFIDKDIVVENLSKVLSGVDQVNTASSNFPTSVYLYEIHVTVPDYLLDDINDSIFLPKTEKEAENNLYVVDRASTRFQPVNPTNDQVSLTDFTTQNPPPPKSDGKSPFELILFVYQDKNDASMLSCRKVTSFGWSVFKGCLVESLTEDEASTFRQSGKTPDIGISMNVAQVFNPKRSAKLSEKVKKIISGIKIRKTDSAFIFTDLDQEMIVSRVLRKRKTLWPIFSEMDIEVIQVQDWIYPQGNSLGNLDLNTDGFGESDSLFPENDSSPSQNYSEVSIVPSKLRHHILENIDMGIGERPSWSVESLSRDIKSSLKLWFSTAKSIKTQLNQL